MLFIYFASAKGKEEKYCLIWHQSASIPWLIFSANAASSAHFQYITMRLSLAIATFGPWPVSTLR